ncbi:hypothetical protein D9M72_263430 [compost metagenome]
MAAPEGGEQRTAHFGLDLVFLVVLVGLGPDSPAHVVDEDVQPAEALHRGGGDAMAFGEPLEVGGQGQHPAVRAQLVLQLEDQLGTVHGNHPCTLLHQPLGHAAADALRRAGDQRDLVLESLVHGSLFRWLVTTQCP